MEPLFNKREIDKESNSRQEDLDELQYKGFRARFEFLHNSQNFDPLLAFAEAISQTNDDIFNQYVADNPDIIEKWKESQK